MQFLSIKDTCRRVGVSRTKLWDLTKTGQFPRIVQITEGRKGYLDDEVDKWIAARVAERDAKSQGGQGDD